MKFFEGLLETKGEEEVRHAMAGRYHTWEGMPYKIGWSVERAVREGIERSSIVFKCVDTIATSGSRLPVVVREGGREPQHEIIEGHPLGKFFGGMVNEFETGSQFLYRVITLFLLAKQGVPIEVTRNRMGKVAGLYILPPDQTMPVPGRGKFIDHWRIEAADGEVYELAPENVLWIRRPHPTDPYASLTPMEAAGITIDVDFYARLFNRDFMLSDGRPSGLVSVSGVRDEDVDELNRRFRGGGIRRTISAGPGSRSSSHGAAAGEISVVDSEKIDFVDLHTSQRDAQYVESMGITKDDIMLAFGVPESVMGNASGRCVDEDTEALTQRGWVSGHDLTEDDTILSMDLTDGHLKWGPVREVYRKEDYTGPMWEFHGARVSEGHKWVVESRPGQGVRSAPEEPFTKKRIEDLSTHDRVIVMGENEPGVEEAEFSNAFVELVGWAVTEGHYFPNDWSRVHRPGKVAPSVCISQNPGEMADRIRMCIKEAGGRYHESSQFAEDEERNEILRFDVRGEIAAALQEVTPDKVMTPDFMLALTASQRELLIETMIDADGSRQESTASVIYTQASRERAENMVFLATLAGRRTSLRLKESTRSYDGEPTSCWQVIVGSRKVVTAQNGARKRDDRGGEFIWCPRTDHGTFVARRDGKVFVTSNTFDNADAEKEAFWEATMVPSLDMVFTALDALTGAVDDDEFLCADTSSVDVLQRAQREREDRLQAQFDKGLISADEYREETGRDPWARPGSRVGYMVASGKIAVGIESDEEAVAGMTVLGSPEPGEEGGAGMPSTNGVGAKGRATRRTVPTADYRGAEIKHADHDQSSHGRWARDPSLLDIADDHARVNMIDRFEVRDSKRGEMLGTVHRHGDEDGPWVARRLDGRISEHADDRDAAVDALYDTEHPGKDSGEPFHPSFLRPGDRFEVVGAEDLGTQELVIGWTHRRGDTSLRVANGVVKLGDDGRVRLVEVKHDGPGPHTGTGTPQRAHASGVDFAPDGRGGAFEVVRRAPVDFLAKALPDAGFDYHDVMADADRGKRIREAYLAAESDTPEAKRAFAALAMEVEEQHRMLTEDLGVTVDVVDEDPYADVDELLADLQENRRIAVLSTAATGSHPFFTNEQNDQFRAVHDAFGHAGTGRGFGRHGEEAAWAAHSRMFGPLAARAMTSETRGQNSTMVWGGDGFPEQKVALLPDFAQSSEVTLREQKSMTAADRDNLYHLSGVHHASNGRWMAGAESKHLGPGPHPNGTPQSVHGKLTPTGVAKRTMRDGGLTIRLGENIYPDGGFAVAAHPEAERVYAVEEFQRDRTGHVQKYVTEHADLLDRPDRYLGTWLDTEGGKVYLDVSIVLQDKDEAMQVARDHDEIAIFDLGAFEDVRVEEGASA